MRSTKLATIGYWTTTCLIAAAFVLGGAVDAVRAPGALAIMGHLGYPAYFASIVGVWKVLGGIALLAPRFPRLKEWAYAGIFFDLTGAAISHAASGDGAANVLPPLVLVALAFLSWKLRPQSRRLGVIGPIESEARPPRVREVASV